MIKNILKDYSEIKNNDKLFFLTFSLFPISLILGNLVINVFISLFSLSFLFNLKQNPFLKNKIAYLLLFFFLSLLVNVFFSQYPINSLPRVIKFIFIAFFIIETLRIFNKYNSNLIKRVFLIWSVIFIIVLLDCIFEIIFGFNTLGISTTLTGRIASFFGEELVVGAFVHGFALFFIGYLISQNSNNYILSFCICTIIIISFLIGERSNFLKLFFSITIFSIIGIKTNYYYKILTFVVFVSLALGIMNFNKDYKYRYFTQIQNLYQKDGLINYYKNSQYGAHHSTAIKIFYEFPLFGVGIKNFRHESYHRSVNLGHKIAVTTHPHQIHLEFLSELGIVGYILLMSFLFYTIFNGFLIYRTKNDIAALSATLFIIATILPILPSGSFFTTYGATIFWINFSFICRHNYNYNK